MIIAAIFIAGVMLVELHGPDGARILLNPDAITSMRAPSGTAAPGMKCALSLANGGVLGVRETCEDVRNIISRRDGG